LEMRMTIWMSRMTWILISIPTISPMMISIRILMIPTLPMMTWMMWIWTRISTKRRTRTIYNL
jgi:hypothetical protein